MLRRMQKLLAAILVCVTSTYAHAGMGFHYAGATQSGDSGQPYNFAVSTTAASHAGSMAAATISEGSSTRLDRHRSLGKHDPLTQWRSSKGINGSRLVSASGSVGGGTRRRATSTASGQSSFSQGTNQTGQGGIHQTSPTTVVNSRDDHRVEEHPKSDDKGPKADGDDDDDDDDDPVVVGGGSGDDDDDDDDDSAPSPSVVPEPATFALWSLAGIALIAATRRR